jgi:hypothetical protein
MVRGIRVVGDKLRYFITTTDFNLKLETEAIVLVFPFFMIMFAPEWAVTKTSIPAGYFGKF